ncbi:NADP-dependent oxidoreductase domain-containing protein [Boletus edulis BED1]|uniref:NADP-dependent oxidoreductase domain-containing protein n=1 Tax=Boletus edulis BED1 TaxID=1328754 RepID=A0AAD4G5R5_BOLED|nr:NADP-dependent oxidoreductase domain-containing protein [Boletus edulis BED1]
MEAAKAVGLTKSIGVSNFTADHLKDILEVAIVIPAVNQVEAHPYDRDFVLRRVITYILSVAKVAPLTQSSKKSAYIWRKTRGSPLSDGQVLNKWLQQKDVLVVTSSKAERIREYLDTENVPELTPQRRAPAKDR